MENHRIFSLLCSALLLLLCGCTLSDQHGDPLAEFVTGGDLTVPKYVQPDQRICLGDKSNKPCYCMVCENKTSWNLLGLGWLFNYYDSNLAGGNCSIGSCNATDFTSIVEDEQDLQMRSFMLGAGSSFLSAGNANLYCNYTMQLATKWMRGTAGSPPSVPLSSRATCILERNSLPIYIYYTGGEAIDPARTGEIAAEFAGKGPVILTTEVLWDGADEAQARLVQEQIIKLSSCEKCMVVLAVRPNDYNALYNTVGMPGAIRQDIYDRIDAIGFGFRANDYPFCDTDRIFNQNLNFSAYILKNYSKPTIWLYAGASEGNSSDGSCQWDSTMVANFYQTLLARTPGLASSGIIGMSMYEFVDGSGPLPCNGVQGCSFGMMDASGAQKHPAMNSWADMCQEIGANSEYRTPLIFSKNGEGSTCDAMRNSQAQFHSAVRIESSQAYSASDVLPEEKIDKLGCGEVCPGNESMKQAIYDGTAQRFNNNDDQCRWYPIIDEYADGLDISATYMRATFEQESGLDQFAFSCANITINGLPNGACNKEEYTAAQICELAGNPEGCKATHTCPEGQKPCAYGLAQCIEYPGKAYTPENPYGQVPGGLPDAIANCGGEKYNPFDPGQSACCGVNKFSLFLRDAPDSTEKWVNANWNQLSKCDGGMKPDEKGWAAYYLASNRYFGTKWREMPNFISQRDTSGECTGTQHYISYLRTVIASPSPGTEYGAQVMSRYRDAALDCKSDCPR